MWLWLRGSGSGGRGDGCDYGGDMGVVKGLGVCGERAMGVVMGW